MPSEEIKKIMKINAEINDLIIDLEKKQRNFSNELINLIIEKDQRIAELEQELGKLKGMPISGTADLTEVLSDNETYIKKPIHSKATGSLKTAPSKVANLISSEGIISGDKKDEELSEKSATISRYGSVAVLKRPGGSKKFKPRTQVPSPKPNAKPVADEVTPSKKINKDALILLENLKGQISEETTTHDLYKILEDVRDELANIIGFSSVIRDIGTVSNKLKHAPDLTLDASSIEAFIKKVESWKENI